MPVFPTRAEPFEAFVAPARARPELWRLVAGTALAAAVWVALAAAGLPLAPARFADPAAGWCSCSTSASFAALIPALALAARLLQRPRARKPVRARRLPAARLRPRRRARWRCCACLGALPLVALGAAAPAGGARGPGRRGCRWRCRRSSCRSAAEELAFRGYLMQGLAARFRSRAGLVAAAGGALRAPALEPGGARPERRLGGAERGADRPDPRRRHGPHRQPVGGDGAAFRQQHHGDAGRRVPSPLSASASSCAASTPADTGRAAPAAARRPRRHARGLRASGAPSAPGRRRLHSRGPGSI